MKIAVVGATGPTGQLVVKQLLNRGHEVVAYVRRPEALEAAEGLVVVGGELADTDHFADAIAGCEVLVCTLGTRSMRERNFMSTHLPLVTAAMEKAGVPRLVLMSALGGGRVPAASRGAARLVFQFMSKWVFGDRTKSEEVLDRQGLNWAAVYPGFLNDKPAAASVDVVPVDEVHDVRDSKISREDVAQVLVRLAEDENSRGQRLVIAKSGAVKR